MKKRNIYFPLLALLFVLGIGCEPIEVRDTLKNNTTKEAVQLSVEHKASGGNEFTIKMSTPGVVGYWSTGIAGKVLSNEATIITPIVGKSTFTFIGSLGNEFFEKTLDVTVASITTPLHDTIVNLVGGDNAKGQTWVLAIDRPEKMAPYENGPSAMYSFMSSPEKWTELWWNAGECCPPVDKDAEMNFNFDGAANYTYTLNGEVKKGSFVIDPINATLTIVGADLVGAYGAPGQISDTKGGVYQVKKLSRTEMVLYQVHGTGWTWIFKPKGYVYPTGK